MRKRIGAGLAALALAGALGACGAQAKRGTQDAPITSDNSQAEVVNFGDNWPNVQTKCSHGTRLFVVARDGADHLDIVPGDPTCNATVR